MDAAHIIGLALSAIISVASWEGWRLLRGHFSPPPLPHHPRVNGFDRDDHASLVLISDKLTRIDLAVGKMDNIIGRLVVVMEINEALKPPK